MTVGWACNQILYIELPLISRFETDAISPVLKSVFHEVVEQQHCISGIQCLMTL